MDVCLKDVGEARTRGVGRLKIDLDVAARVNDRSGHGRVVRDEIRLVAQATQIERFDFH